MERLRIALGYDGPEGEPFEVDDRHLAGVYQPHAGGAHDEEALLARAFQEPIGEPRLQDAASSADSVLLLVDDATRGTRLSEILPHVASELEAAGVQDGRVTVLIARGTHREMDRDEVVQKVGERFVRRWRIMQHDYRDESQLEHFGETSAGMPVVAHRLLSRSDLVVGVGHVGILASWDSAAAPRS